MNRTIVVSVLAGLLLAASAHAEPDDASSFVVVSQRDRRYFELSNGSPYIPIGFNLVPAPNEEEFEKLFRIMAENQVNYCRIWLGHGDWNVEHEHCLQFDPGRAATLDRFLSLARKNGIHIKMCLEYFREIRAERNRWSDNLLYHQANGGPYDGMHDYLSSQKGRSHFKAKLDWYADRYAQNPAVFAWELWNEMDAVRGSEWRDWTKEMLGELRRRFPRHLAVQSLGSYDHQNKRPSYQTLCLLRDNDVAQVHRYLDEGAGWEICHGPVDVLAAQAVGELIAFQADKPVILTETGAVKPSHSGCSALYAKDRDGVLLHDMLFAPFFSGAAGTGHVWWWRQALEEPNLWHHFARFAEAVKGIDPAAEHFEPALRSTDRYRLYVLKGRRTIMAWCRDSQNDWKNELVLSHPPQTRNGMEIDLGPYVPAARKARARIYDPWKNRWQDKTIESGRVTLDEFTRSVVIRVE
ncbi:MAG: cellulase family glycosylhydrolase [Sedimentisphaerales bacterium]|nr:cellulase family glycosylhydrolase [Sedimentisphaerales bacterium]